MRSRVALVALMVIAIGQAYLSYPMMSYLDAASANRRRSQKAESRKGWHNDWMKVQKRDVCHRPKVTARQSFARLSPVSGR